MTLPPGINSVLWGGLLAGCLNGPFRISVTRQLGPHWCLSTWWVPHGAVTRHSCTPIAELPERPSLPRGAPWPTCPWRTRAGLISQVTSLSRSLSGPLAAFGLPGGLALHIAPPPLAFEHLPLRHRGCAGPCRTHHLSRVTFPKETFRWEVMLRPWVCRGVAHAGACTYPRLCL